MRIKRILIDNGKNCPSRVFNDTASEHGIKHKLTRPCRTQTNDKAEAFIKILQNERAYACKYLSNEERMAELSRFIRLGRTTITPISSGGIKGTVPASSASGG